MNIKKRQEIINLMPWYSLGKLSEPEKIMIDEALSDDSSLREQLNLDQDMMSKVLANPELLNRSAFESSTIRLDKVLAQIDETVVTKLANKPQALVREKRQSATLIADIKSFFTDLLTGSSHNFVYAVFAAITVVQLSLLLFIVPLTKDSNDYGVASDGKAIIAPPPITDNKASGLVLVIAMEDNTQVEDIDSKTLGKIKLDLLPNNLSFYRAHLKRKLTPEDTEVLKDELSHKTANVIFVGEEFQSQ